MLLVDVVVVETSIDVQHWLTLLNVHDYQTKLIEHELSLIMKSENCHRGKSCPLVVSVTGWESSLFPASMIVQFLFAEPSGAVCCFDLLCVRRRWVTVRFDSLVARCSVYSFQS